MISKPFLGSHLLSRTTLLLAKEQELFYPRAYPLVAQVCEDMPIGIQEEHMDTVLSHDTVTVYYQSGKVDENL